jgi:hypothetical protein
MVIPALGHNSDGGHGFWPRAGGVCWDPRAKQTLGKLLTHVAIPAVIIKALATATITPPNLIALPLSALAVVQQYVMFFGVLLGSVTYCSYVITAAALADTSSRYSVAVSNEFGSVTSTDAVLTVQAATKFFVVDNTADKTYRYGATGTFIGSTATATNNLNALGIASNPDGSKLWVIDGSKTVYVYSSSLTLLGSWTAGALRTPTGISVAGNDLWIVDAGTKNVHVFSGAASRLSGTQNATRTLALDKNNTAPQDLVTDGTTVWVTQSGTVDRVFVYQATTGAVLGNWSIDTRNTSPVGITLDPSGASSSLWIVDNTTDTVYEYSSSRSRVTGSQSAIRTFAHHRQRQSSGHRRSTTSCRCVHR